MKKFWRWFNLIFLLLYGFVMTFGLLTLGLLIWFTMRDGNALENSRVVNYLSLGIGFFSLPGIIVQLLSIWDLNAKKTFVLTAPCPRCKNSVDWRMTEK